MIKLTYEVDGLGKVLVTSHAIQRAKETGVSPIQFEQALFYPFSITPDGFRFELRERNNVRLVIQLNGDGAHSVVKTVYRKEQRLRVKPRR